MSRVAAIAIGLFLFCLLGGGIILATIDAFAPGHNGYVHNPIGVMCYAIAMLLALPLLALMHELWRGP
jgi:hypothetical protein